MRDRTNEKFRSLWFQMSKIGIKKITKAGFHLHLGIASLSFYFLKNKNKQSFHLPTKAREAHYDVHLLNI